MWQNIGPSKVFGIQVMSDQYFWQFCQMYWPDTDCHRLRHMSSAVTLTSTKVFLSFSLSCFLISVETQVCSIYHGLIYHRCTRQTVVNMSQRTLSADETKVLLCGMNFALCCGQNIYLLRVPSWAH